MEKTRNKVRIISINSAFVNDIFDEVKNYDVRKVPLPEELLNKKLYVYSTTKNKAIVGYLNVDKIIEGTSEELFKYTGYELNTKLGKSIYQYLHRNGNRCYAMHLNNVTEFQEPLTLKEMQSVVKETGFGKYLSYIKEDDPLCKVIEEWDKAFSLDGNGFCSNVEETKSKILKIQ